MIAFVRRCDNLECKGGKGGMRQKVYKTRKGKEGMLQFVPNTSACKAVPKSVLLISPSDLQKCGLRLRHPVGEKKFGHEITEEDVRTWHKKQKFPMICSQSKGRRYACAHIPTHTHTHTHTHRYTGWELCARMRAHARLLYIVILSIHMQCCTCACNS